MTNDEFEIFARKLRPQLVVVAMRFLGNEDDADDITQETLLKLWKIKDQLSVCTSPVSLAIVIARNKSLDRLRRRHDCISLEDINGIVTDSSLNPEQIMIESESDLEVIQLISLLPEKMRKVLHLRHIENLDTHQIADIVGTSEPTVRVALSRARKRVLKIFNKTKK